MDALWTLVPQRDLPVVLANAARLEHDLGGKAWPEQLRPDPAVCRRVSFVVTAIAAQLPYDRLSLLVRYALWTIVLDDELDGPRADPGALNRLCEGVTAVVAGGRGNDPLMMDLAGILGALADHCRAGAVLQQLGLALVDAVACGVEHAALGQAVAAGTTEPPTADQYLEVAARTVNYRSFAYALLALVAGELTGPALDRLDPALRHASHAIRLGNDLRSVPRDHAEATLNVLGLRTAAGSPVTRRYVHQQIDQHVRAHHDVLGALTGPDHADLDLAAPALIRSLRVSLGLYQLTDLR